MDNVSVDNKNIANSIGVFDDIVAMDTILNE